MRFEVYTDKGKVRENNEDSFLANLDPFPIFAVADGMGGHRAGEVASKIAIDYIRDYDFYNKKDLLMEIESLITEINSEIYIKGKKHQDYSGMGTTLSLGLINNLELYIGHIGDSRIYLFRNGQLEQITTDHSLVNKLLQKEQITRDEAFNHPQRHILTQSLGTDIDVKVEVRKVPLVSGDILLFCTDGLSDMIRFQELEKIILENNDLAELSTRLGEKAMKNGGSDNITLIVSEVK